MNVTGMVGHLAQFIAPVSNYVSSKCRFKSLQYTNGIAQGFPWALAMLDATGKPQAGLLEGNINSFGNFEACIDVKPPQSISTQYCIAVLGLEKKHPKNRMEEMLASKGLFWGLCLPSTCSTSDVSTGLSEWMSDWDLSVTRVSCQDSHIRPMEPIDWIAVCVLILLVMVIIISTAYDIYSWYSVRRHPDMKIAHYDMRIDLFTSFSVLQNGQELLMRAGKSDLSSLYGIRFFSICWVMLSNTCNIITALPAMNYFYVYNLLQSWTFMPNVRFSLAVESFLVVSGLLTTIKFLSVIPRNANSKNLCEAIALFYIHRYLRIAPTLAMLILLQVSLWRHIGSGPLFNYITVPPAEYCNKNWYWALLFVQNYAVGKGMCLEHSWYLNVDLQLYVLSPLVLIPLLHWKLWISLLVFVCLIALGFVSSFLVNFLNNFPAGYIIGDIRRRTAQTRYFVITTHTRFSSYVVGMLVGYLLYKYKVKDKKTPPSLNVQILLWVTTFVAIVYAVFGALPFNLEEYEFEAVGASIFIAAVPIVWSLGIGWIVFTCETYQCHLFSSILGYRGLQPFGRLVYCIYLGNLPLLTLRASTVRSPVYISFSGIIMDFVGNVALATILAVFLFLGVERPCTRIGYIASKWVCDKVASKEDVRTTLAPVVMSTVLHAPTLVLTAVPSVQSAKESDEDVTVVDLTAANDAR